LQNFDQLEVRMAEVEAKDNIRNFQPPVSGQEIMDLFGLAPGRIIGVIKDRIKDAILEGEIRNDRAEAWQFMIRIAAEEGIYPTGGKT